MQKLSRALAELQKGSPVVLYDGDEREGEADLILNAKFITPKKIRLLRKDGGGLICLAIDQGVANQIGLPFFTDMLKGSGLKIKGMSCVKTAYGDQPAFSLPINSKNVYTGITDNDRCITIKEMSRIIEKNNGIGEDFIKSFYSPGHVFLLISRGLENRKGHTELSIELSKKAKLPGCMVLCEMLGNGKALPKKEAKEYAEKHNLVFLEGKDIA